MCRYPDLGACLNSVRPLFVQMLVLLLVILLLLGGGLGEEPVATADFYGSITDSLVLVFF